MAAGGLSFAVRGLRALLRNGASSVRIALAPGRVRLLESTLLASDHLAIRLSARSVIVERGEEIVFAWVCGSEPAARWLADVLGVALRASPDE